jgi:hypothetical protein
MFYAKRQRLCIFLLLQDRNSEISEENIFPTQLMLLIPGGLVTVSVLNVYVMTLVDVTVLLVW